MTGYLSRYSLWDFLWLIIGIIIIGMLRYKQMYISLLLTFNQIWIKMKKNVWYSILSTKFARKLGKDQTKTV